MMGIREQKVVLLPEGMGNVPINSSKLWEGIVPLFAFMLFPIAAN
jgi:hypothetical protein